MRLVQTYLLSIGIFVVNMILKIIYLTKPPIGGDEPFSIFYAQTDYSTLAAMLPTENNPPFYTIFLKYWVELFGIEPFTVRFPSLVFSSICAAVIFHIGKRFYGTFTGLFASLIFTFASFQVYFAHEARPYALFALLTAISMLFFLKLVIDKIPRAIIGLTIVNIILIYTHFFGFFVLFVQFTAFLLISDIRKKQWKPLIISWGITFLAFLPYLPIILRRYGESSNGTWLPTPSIVNLYDNIWRFSNEPVNTVLFLAILFTGLIVSLLRRHFSTRSKIIILWFLLPYFTMFALSFKMPMFLDRYLIYISVAFYLLIGIAIQALFKNEKSKWIFGAPLIILMMVTCKLDSGNPRDDEGFVKAVSALNGPKTSVFVSPYWYYQTFAYHHHRDHFKDYKNTTDRLSKEGIYLINQPTKVQWAQIKKADTIVYVDAGAWLIDPQERNLNHLRSTHQQIDANGEFEPFRIFRFVKH